VQYLKKGLLRSGERETIFFLPFYPYSKEKQKSCACTSCLPEILVRNIQFVLVVKKKEKKRKKKKKNQGKGCRRRGRISFSCYLCSFLLLT
jgi:hypothetical protein